MLLVSKFNYRGDWYLLRRLCFKRQNLYHSSPSVHVAVVQKC